MRTRLIAAWPLERYEVWLSFSDGVEGVVDMEAQLRGLRQQHGVRSVDHFRQLRVDRMLNRLAWPDGPVIDPMRLHRQLARTHRRPR